MKSRRSSAARAMRSGTEITSLPLARVTGSAARLRLRNRWQMWGSSGGKAANQTAMLKKVSKAASVRCS